MNDGWTPDESESKLVTNGVKMPSSSDEFARWAYRLLLNKDVPDSLPADIENNPDIFMRKLLRTPEFRQRYVELVWHFGSIPYRSWNKDAVAFIRLKKTGSTTLDSLLRASFPNDRVFPYEHELLHLWSPSELADYDLFSGHFDWFALRYIPRQRVRTVTMLRDPFKRLISDYRFCRSHSPRVFAHDEYFRLANELGPEEFFEHESVIRQIFFNNNYLLVFGASLFDSAVLEALAAEAMEDASRDQPKGETAPSADPIATALTRAKERIAGLDAIGLTEKFSESMETIFRTLKLPVPQAVEARNVTDDLPDKESQFSRVPPVTMTPRLARALKRLTKYDQIIYDFAKSQFARRTLEEHPRLDGDRAGGARADTAFASAHPVAPDDH